jgi:hypothetical protein
MGYYTSAGPKSGTILWRDDCATIDVLRDPGDYTPIGTATPMGSAASGIAIWEIVVGYTRLPGRWIVLGGEFLLKR